MNRCIFKTIVLSAISFFHLSSLGMMGSHKIASPQKSKTQSGLAKTARHNAFQLYHKKMAEKPVLLLKNEPENLDFFSGITSRNQKWNRYNVLSIFPSEVWDLVVDQGDKKADLRSNLRLVCWDFLQKICLPETNRLKVYRALKSLCSNDQAALDVIKTQEVNMSYEWVSYFPVGCRMTLTLDPEDKSEENKLYTSWEEMRRLCDCNDPYVDGQGKHMLETDRAKKSGIYFHSTVQEATARLNSDRRKTDQVSSFLDKKFRLIAACIVGDSRVARSLLTDCVNSENLKDIILPTAAIAVKNNDVKMLSVFGEVLKNAKNPHKFYNTHMYLLNLALAQNKEPAFDTLNTFVLHGEPATRITPCALRIKMMKRYGEIIESKKSPGEKMQDLQGFMMELGFTKEGMEREGGVWRVFHFFTGNTTYANINDMSYAGYLSYMTNYIDVDRRGRGWKAQRELFQMQDKDWLEKEINIPMQQAIKNNDSAYIEKTICLIDEKVQYQLNQQNKAALLAMHIKWLKLAKSLQHRDAFYMMHAFQPSWIGCLEQWISRKISEWAHARDTMDYKQPTRYEVFSDAFNVVFKYVSW